MGALTVAVLIAFLADFAFDFFIGRIAGIREMGSGLARDRSATVHARAGREAEAQNKTDDKG